LNLKRKKGLLVKVLILTGILLISTMLLTGCVKGMTAIGWAGVAIDENGNAYTASKEGRLVSVNLSNNSIQFAESLKTPSSGGFGCASSASSSGSACGGSSTAVAIYGTPALTNVPVLGNLVYLAGYNGKIFAYDAASLQQRWVYPVDSYLGSIVSAITISGDTLYFGCSDKKLYALDTATGALKWSFSTGGEIWSSPSVEGNSVFISSFDKKIYAIDTATGEKRWEFVTGATNVSTPVVANGIVYAGSLDRNLYALDANSGSLIWKFEGGNWFWTKPVVYNGVIYAPCFDNKVYILDAKTGNTVAGPFEIDGKISSWPVIMNNKVVFATENGKLLSLDTTNLSQGPTQVATIVNNVTAPLATSGDIVYINGSDNTLYGYNITTGAKQLPVSLKFQ